MFLASIVSGHDADIWMLVALILFVIATIWALTDRAFQAALVPAGLAFVALGFLVT